MKPGPKKKRRARARRPARSEAEQSQARVTMQRTKTGLFGAKPCGMKGAAQEPARAASGRRSNRSGQRDSLAEWLGGATLVASAAMTMWEGSSTMKEMKRVTKEYPQ